MFFRHQRGSRWLLSHAPRHQSLERTSSYSHQQSIPSTGANHVRSERTSCSTNGRRVVWCWKQLFCFVNRRPIWYGVARSPAKPHTIDKHTTIHIQKHCSNKGCILKDESNLEPCSESRPHSFTQFQTWKSGHARHAYQDHHKIVVHEHYLTRTSDFFAAALKKAWIEGQTRVIELREETPENMEFYCDFVYTGQLPTRIFIKRDSGHGMAPAFELLANLFVLGERRLDTKLRNAVICEMMRIHKLPPTPPVLFGGSPFPSAPSTTSVNIIYQGTPEGSPARRLMVDMVLRFGSQGWHSPDVDQAFLFEVMEGFLELLKDASLVQVNRRRELQTKDYLL